MRIPRAAALLILSSLFFATTSALQQIYQPHHSHTPPSTSKYLARASGEEDGTVSVPLGDSICRVVAAADGKIPTSKSILLPSLNEYPGVLDKLDLIYHSLAHKQTQSLSYMDARSNENDPIGPAEEERLVSVLKESLHDAGFQRLTQRDLDLCDALNSGYLLSLSIQPDVANLDPSLADEFYSDESTDPSSKQQHLFDGRVLVYRRGYSSEISKGRLLLPKLDYLQASLVQQSAYKLTQRLGRIERSIMQTAGRFTRGIRISTKTKMNSLADLLPTQSLVIFFKEKLGWKRPSFSELRTELKESKKRDNVFFRLSRYGGDSSAVVAGTRDDVEDDLSEFQFKSSVNGDMDGEVIQQVGRKELYEGLKNGRFTCQYDVHNKNETAAVPSTLLERISISNVVDVFSASGRKRMVKSFFAKVKLVEPTYEEVVVIWRPLPKKSEIDMKVRPPKVVYDVAEIFDMEEQLPEKRSLEEQPLRPPLEIRAFTKVPMANIPAVFPKTRLLFRPQDAVRIDLISLSNLLLVLGSQRFDSPQLDLLAIIAVSLWLFKTVFRYSNKLSRYDLLVKKFLTSKIAHRDGGALEYITNEAGTQRAARAALVFSWLTTKFSQAKFTDRETLVADAFVGVNSMLETEQYVDVNVRAAISDLEGLGLISFSKDHLMDVANDEATVDALRIKWDTIFDAEQPVGVNVPKEIVKSKVSVRRDD